MKGVLAQKIGMTRMICPETGKVTPVTLLQVPGCEVVQVKTQEKDGYESVVLGSFERKNFGKNTNKKFKYIKELKIDAEGLEKGKVLGVDFMEGVEDVKITGISKGRGFSGVIKRHNFARGRETHGSHHHREPGSVGMCAKPGRVIKGKKLPGHYGGDQVSFLTKLLDIDTENNLLAIRGGIPGAKNSYVMVVQK